MQQPEQHYRKKTGIRLGFLSIAVNLFLFSVKIILGLLSNSLSIISDAFHTLTDILTSFLVVISFKVSSKPSDAEHPFGHGRAEQIAAIVMAILIGVTGFELIKYGVSRLIKPVPFQGSFWMAGLIFLTVIIKEWLAWFTKRYSNRIDSSTLAADAWHHHTDAMSSFLVVIAIILARYNIYWLDGLTGIIIGFYIFYIAFKISQKPIDKILGEPIPGNLTKQINKIINKISEVQNHHNIVYHEYGSLKIVSMHIEVAENMTLSHAHTISEIVTSNIYNELGIHATVHVDPVMKKTPLYFEVEKTIESFFNSQNINNPCHHLRLVWESNWVNILVEMQMSLTFSKSDENRLKNELLVILKNKFPRINKVIITIESPNDINK